MDVTEHVYIGIYNKSTFGTALKHLKKPISYTNVKQFKRKTFALICDKEIHKNRQVRQRQRTH